MAFYVNNLIGSDSNNGLSEAAPFATLNKLNNLTGLAASEIVRVKYTGIDYTLTDNGTNTAVDFFRDNTLTSRTVYLTNWLSDGDNRPKIISTRSLVNQSSTWNFNCSIKNITFNIDDLTVATNGWNITFGTVISYFRSVNLNYIRTGGSYTTAKNVTGALLASLIGCNFNFNNGYSLIQFSGATLITDNIIRNIYGATSVSCIAFSASAVIMKNIFYNVLNASTSTSSGIFTTNSGAGVFSNNVVVVSDVISSATACRVFPVATNFAKTFSNIFINNRTSGQVYFSSALTQSFPAVHNLGNNAFKSFTGIWNGGSLTGYPSTADESQFGDNITLVASPFISETFGNPDFLQLDDSTASGLACIGSAFYDPNCDLGRYQSAGGGIPGETDPNKVLNTSTIITGNYIPVVAADVRDGTSFGLSQTGVLDLPIEADVNLGVSYDNNTKTGTKRDTSPTEDKVVAGETWYSNSVLKTGTRTSIYALLASNVVKIGVDRGDGTFGDYTAIERYSDIDLSQVANGYSFRYNSLTDNRTGTRTAIYPLLPVNVVQYQIDRGDGLLGTDKGENFNTPITANILKIGQVILSLNNTITGTYTAEERYTDLQLQHVRLNHPWKYNSLTNNRLGELELPSTDDVRENVVYDHIHSPQTGNVRIPSAIDVREDTIYDSTNPALEKTGILNIDDEANLPLENKVLTGSGAYGYNLDKIPSYSPDFPSASNVSANDTTNGTQGTIPLSAIKAGVGAGTLPLNKIAPSQGGSYLGEESNDILSANELESGLTKLNRGNTINGTNKGENFNSVITEDIIKSGEVIENLGNEITGTYTGSSTVIPDNKILLGYPNPTTGNNGTLGKIDTTKPFTISMQIRDNTLNNLVIPSCVGWKPFEYLENVELNNFKTNFKRYGIEINDLKNSSAPLTGQETIERSFTLKLMTRFIPKTQSDNAAVLAKEELIAKAEEIRRKGVVNNWGNFSSVMGESSADELKVSMNYEEGYALLELTYSITYSIDRL